MDKAMDNIKTGRVTLAVDQREQLPDLPCNRVNIKALRANSGNVYVGGSDVDGLESGDNTVTGFELDAGEETGWMPVSNLNKFHAIAGTDGDGLCFIVLR